MNDLSPNHKPVATNLMTGRGEGINPIDFHVGQRLKLRRIEVGLTQGKLGDKIGVSFQQIQKYERGANRICASRLHLFSIALEVTIQYFFDDMPEEIKGSPSLEGINIEALKQSYDDIHRRQHLELHRTFSKMADPVVRKQFIDLGKAINGDLKTTETAQ